MSWNSGSSTTRTALAIPRHRSPGAPFVLHMTRPTDHSSSGSVQRGSADRGLRTEFHREISAEPQQVARVQPAGRTGHPGHALGGRLATSAYPNGYMRSPGPGPSELCRNRRHQHSSPGAATSPPPEVAASSIQTNSSSDHPWLQARDIASRTPPTPHQVHIQTTSLPSAFA